jgi:hypothetical protein
MKYSSWLMLVQWFKREAGSADTAGYFQPNTMRMFLSSTGLALMQPKSPHEHHESHSTKSCLCHLQGPHTRMSNTRSESAVQQQSPKGRAIESEVNDSYSMEELIFE